MKAYEFASLLPECCSEVLDAMYFTTLLDSASLEQAPEALSIPCIQLAFKLRFVGSLSGRFSICLEEATARHLAANFLGEESDSLSSIEVVEVASELANMLCGSVMSRIEGEHKFVLSHPEATSPVPLTGNEEAFSSRLETDNGAIMVWIVIEEAPCRT